jgi:hypothetical protein
MQRFYSSLAHSDTFLKARNPTAMAILPPKLRDAIAKTFIGYPRKVLHQDVEKLKLVYRSTARSSIVNPEASKLF